MIGQPPYPASPHPWAFTCSLWAQNLELMEREGSEELGLDSPRQLREEDGPASSFVPRACSC